MDEKNPIGGDARPSPQHPEPVGPRDPDPTEGPLSTFTRTRELLVEVAERHRAIAAALRERAGGDFDDGDVDERVWQAIAARETATATRLDLGVDPDVAETLEPTEKWIQFAPAGLLEEAEREIEDLAEAPQGEVGERAAAISRKLTELLEQLHEAVGEPLRPTIDGVRALELELDRKHAIALSTHRQGDA